MNKADLIAKMAADAKLTKADAERALNAFVGTVKKTLRKGENISLVGFGTFTVTKRKARTGLNPQTREKIKIKAARVPKFKPGKTLKNSI